MLSWWGMCPSVPNLGYATDRRLYDITVVPLYDILVINFGPQTRVITKISYLYCDITIT